MSYILDALRKSEQERGQGRVPDVQTVHSSGLNYRRDKRSYWPYVLITAVLLNLAAITYFIFTKDDVQTQNLSTTSITPQTSEIAAPADMVTNVSDNNDSELLTSKNESAENSIHQEIRPVAENPQTMAAYPAIIKQEKTREPAAEPGDPIVNFHELPASLKERLPTITISAHVYSSNPLQRSIVINNNFMEEGEYLIDGMILYEITPDGAIFDYQGTLFNYGVVSGWQ
ncbi:MAG: general secretion pathway protein GspB [Gammaproteobacteria bacterium]|nr:general secretion pathway protein GspB [Gammaproteobacteria bacterium]